MDDMKVIENREKRCISRSVLWLTALLFFCTGISIAGYILRGYNLQNGLVLLLQIRYNNF